METNRRRFLTAGAALAAGGLAAAHAAGQAPPEEDTSRLGQTAHTRFAVNVEMGWSRLPFLQRLEQAARLGYRAVEFWPWRNQDVPAVAAACRRLNLEVAQFTGWGFRPGLNEVANHPRFAEEIE